jgi:hypothetical protein
MEGEFVKDLGDGRISWRGKGRLKRGKRLSLVLLPRTTRRRPEVQSLL